MEKAAVPTKTASPSAAPRRKASGSGDAPESRPEPIRSTDPRTREIVTRLRSVEGHVRGVERMVEEGAYCMDVVNQILGIQRALKKINGLVLDRHLHSCATAAIRGDDPDERERVIHEILTVFDAAGKS